MARPANLHDLYRQPQVVAGALIVLVVALPFAVLLGAVAAREWYPASDQAIQVLQISEVGTDNTPLLGAYSRWGFNHPGPLLYYVAAPLATVAGTSGVLLSVVVINAAASGLVCFTAWRRGGLALAGIASTILVILLGSVGADRLVGPWNPHAVLLALLAFGLACWSVAERDVWFLPLAALLGSFLVQAHVGLAVSVGALGVAAIALSWRSRSAVDDTRSPRLLGPRPARPLLVAVGVAALVWLPPAVEQITSNPGNITELARFARDPAAPATGFSAAARVGVAHLGVPPAWLTGLDEPASDVHASVWTWIGGLAVVGLLVGLGWFAARRGHHGAGRLSGLAAVLIVATTLGVARISGPAFSYLLLPWWSTSAFAWMSIAWSGWCLTRHRLTRARAGLVVAGTALIAVLAVALMVNALRVDVPLSDTAQALEVLAPETRRAVQADVPQDARLTVRWADQRNLGALGIGMFLYLDQNGYEVFVAPKHERAFDSWHIGERNEVTPTVWVVGSDDVLMGIAIPDTAIEVATFDPLSRSERARHDELWRSIARQSRSSPDVRPSRADTDVGRSALVADGADPAKVDELSALREGSSGYVVYLLDGPPS